MKKKILSLALSGLLAFSAVFGLAACKPQENSGNNGANSGNGNNSGNNGNGGNNGSNENTNNNGSGIKPGTVITDETVKNSVFSALAEAEIEGLTYSGSINLSVVQDAMTQAQKITLEGAFQLDEDAEGDLYLTIDGEDDLLYLLGFLRKDGVYYTMGDAEGKTVDFSALKADLKSETDPLILEKGETGPAQSILAAPATVKLLKNMASLFAGVVTKTEGGYSLAFDLAEGIEDLFVGAEAVAEAIDKTAAMTLTGLFSQKFVNDTLTSLLNGITAKELADFITLLPAELQTALPKPESGTAKDYLLGLLRSGSFYTAVAGEGEPWTNYQTFGEVLLSDVVSVLTDGEVELGSLKLKEMLQDFAEGFENRIVSLLVDLLSIEGTVTEEDFDLAVTFSFDDDKKLLGLALDALAEGNVSENGEEQQPDGGTQPEDGSGDQMTATESSAKRVHIGLKLSATCAQSPELFDLKGCQYQGENGAVTIE